MSRMVLLLQVVAARHASGAAALRGLSSSKDDGYDYSNLVLLALAALLALCCAGKQGGAVRGAVGSTLRRVTVRNTVEPAPQRSSSSSSKELAPHKAATANVNNKAGQIVLGQYPPTREVDKLFAPQWVGPDRKPEDPERARDSQQSRQVEPTRARESRQSKQSEPKRSDEEPLEEKDDLSDDGERVEAASEAAAPKPDRDGAP